MIFLLFLMLLAISKDKTMNVCKDCLVKIDDWNYIHKTVSERLR